MHAYASYALRLHAAGACMTCIWSLSVVVCRWLVDCAAARTGRTRAMRAHDNVVSMRDALGMRVEHVRRMRAPVCAVVSQWIRAGARHAVQLARDAVELDMRNAACSWRSCCMRQFDIWIYDTSCQRHAGLRRRAARCMHVRQCGPTMCDARDDDACMYAMYACGYARWICCRMVRGLSRAQMPGARYAMRLERGFAHVLGDLHACRC